jgi:hypothetical protein
MGLIRCSKVILHEFDNLVEKEKVTQEEPYGNHKPNATSKTFVVPRGGKIDGIAGGDALAVPDTRINCLHESENLDENEKVNKEDTYENHKSLLKVLKLLGVESWMLLHCRR